MESIRDALVNIVDEEHVSNRPEELFIYSFDHGTAEPHPPDYVVAPRTTEQIQEILRLVNRAKIPVVPLGGRLSLAGLAVPARGGILIDLKRDG
jgi:glycolate oxidase